MTIEEKPRAIEFTFVPEGVGGDLRYDIIYDEGNTVFPLRVSTGGNQIDYPLELFVDVVEFLTNKGVVKSSVTSVTVPSLRPHSAGSAVLSQSKVAFPSGNSIPVPQVVRNDGSTSHSVSANMDPLASFDITSPKSVIPASVAPAETSVLSGSSDGNAPPIPQIVKAGSDGIVMHSPADPAPSISPVLHSPTPTPPASSEMTNRPVIRSRVVEGDSRSAEAIQSEQKEMAIMRDSGKGAGKTVRKAHRAEGE